MVSMHGKLSGDEARERSVAFAWYRISNAKLSKALKLLALWTVSRFKMHFLIPIHNASNFRLSSLISFSYVNSLAIVLEHWKWLFLLKFWFVDCQNM